MVDTLYIRLAEVTGREVDEIRADARRGRYLTVPEAVAYGLLDGQAGPGDRPGRPRNSGGQVRGPGGQDRGPGGRAGPGGQDRGPGGGQGGLG